MIEWVVATLLLLAFLVLAARKGHRHLLGKKLPWAIVGFGGVLGWMLESLPFSPFRAPFSLLTGLAVVCGLLAGRLFARGLVGWARGLERDLAAGAPPPTGIAARLIHPLIALGLFLSGTCLLYLVVAARHETLETALAIRDPETKVLVGAEDRRLDAPGSSRAVLLVHGFNGSPADFGDLPDRLHAAGMTVRVLRLPGHATTPASLDAVTPDEALANVDEARKELEATHAQVSLVGFSYGGALSIRSAAARPPHRLVLVNPWLGENVRPAWFPVPLGSGGNVVASMTARVVRPWFLRRCNDPEGWKRVRAYLTIRTKAMTECREFARGAAAPEVAAKLTSPALLLLSNGDRTNPAERGAEWFATLHAASGAARRVARFDKSDHLLFLDYDREAATAAVLEFLRE